MSAKTLKSEVAAAAVATSGCGPEGVEVVEGAEVEQAFGRLEHLYAQLPAMEEKGAALARARSAATVDGLKDQLKQIMQEQNTDTLTGTEHKATYKAVTSSRIDTTALKRELPGVAAQYTKATETRRFTFS